MCKADDVCTTNPGDGPDICVAWDEMNDPEMPDDFTVDYGCEGCEAAPEVKLIAGSDTWRVWSVANGGGEGAIGVLWSEDPQNYTVRIIKAVGATETPGASTVGTIDLDPGNAVNYSSLGGGIITGDLTGDLFLQRSSGDSGGTADGFVIGGDVYGDITLYGPTGNGFTIEGDVKPDVTINLERGEGFTIEGGTGGGDSDTYVHINIDEIDGGAFLIEGFVDQYTTIGVGTITDGGLDVGLGTERFVWITIATMGSESRLRIGHLNPNPPPAGMDAQVRIKSDLPADAAVDLSGADLGGFGALSFKDDGNNFKDIHGTVEFWTVTEVVEADDLTGTIDIKRQMETPTPVDFPRIVLAGSMSGTILVNSNEIDGSLGGDITIGGDMTDSALIKVFRGTYGYFEEPANITVGDVGSSASIVFQAAVIGDVSVGDLAGDILVERFQFWQSAIEIDSIAGTGVLFFGKNVDGDTHVTGDVAGDIVAGAAGDPVALLERTSIDIDGALTGDLIVTGDVEVGAVVTVDSLGAAGRILIDGLCKDDLFIDKGTASTPLIQMIDGLDGTATLWINHSQGQYNAVGDIFIGDPATCGTCDLGNVTYDGVIQVREYSSGGYGDLDGDVTVVGCHATADDLELCVEGETHGTLTIVQTDCDPQVGGFTCTP